jgi:hypothetical protein
MTKTNYDAVVASSLPQQLADEHWDWMKGWLEKAFKDGFRHGYKHGQEEAKDYPQAGVNHDAGRDNLRLLHMPNRTVSGEGQARGIPCQPLPPRPGKVE